MGSTVYASPKLRVSSHDLTVNSTTLIFFLISHHATAVVDSCRDRQISWCHEMLGHLRHLTVTIAEADHGARCRYRNFFENLSRHGTGSLSHRVNGSPFTSGLPGHRVIILTGCETRVFPVFEKMPKMQNLHLKWWNDKSHCQLPDINILTYLLTLSSTPVLDKILDRVLEQ